MVRKYRVPTVGLVLLLALLLISAWWTVAVWGLAGATAGQIDDETPPENEPAAVVHLSIAQTPRLHENVSPGDDVDFSVIITNSGTVRLESISVTNSVATDCNRNNAGPLDPGATTTYSCEVDNVKDSFLNVITAEGSAASSAAVTNRTDAFVQVEKPGIRIFKRPDTQTVTRGSTARFTIAVLNTSSSEILTNVRITDSLVPDCSFDPPLGFNLAPGDSRDYPCSFPDVQAAFAGVATVEATALTSGSAISAADVGWVELLDLQATIRNDPASVPEPGSLVTFTITVNNGGSIPLTLRSLATNQFGDVMNAGNPLIEAGSNSCLPSPTPPSLPPSGGVFECSFVAAVAGQPSNFSVILTAAAESGNGDEISATTNTTVTITDLPSAVTVNVTADPPFVPAPRGTVTYSVRLVNSSEVDSIRINSLRDSILGDLNGQGNCVLPTSLISAGGSYQCSFSDELRGEVGDTIERTITAAGVDDDPTPNPVSNSLVVSVSMTEKEAEQIFLATVADDVVEPNNSCTEAYPVQLNYQYHFLAEDFQDVYYFNLEDTLSIRVEMTNFVPQAGQLVLWKGACGSLTMIFRNPDKALNKTLDVGSQGAGFYVIQILNDGPKDTGVPYGLIVRTGP